MAALNSKGKAKSRVSGKARPKGTPEGKAKAEPKATAKTKGKAEKKAKGKCKAMVESVDVKGLSVRKAAASSELLPDRRRAKVARSSSEPKDTGTTTPSSSIRGTPLCKASTPAPLTRIFTPPPLLDGRESSAGSESESSSEASSGSSDDSKIRRPPASGAASVASLLHEAVADLYCSACQTVGHHGILDCPLVLALAFGGDAKMAEAFVAKIAGSRKWDENWRLRARDIIIPVEARFPVPSDGNCLFSAVAAAYYLAVRPDEKSVPAPATLGNRCRTRFLEWARKQMDEGACFMGTTLSALLIDSAGRWKTADEYVKGMELPVTSRCQWGGFPEFCAIAQWKNLRVWCFVEFQDKTVKLLCEPIGSREATPISLLWCGGCHYDACRLSTLQLNECLL
jgi:hypothetical protein